MTPYYQDTKAGIVIYHGDCRDVLPDLVVVHTSGTWFMEVKLPGGNPTRLQQHVMERIKSAGGKVCVVRSVEDAEDRQIGQDRSGEANGIPWVPTRGQGGWNAPAKMAGLRALYTLECGGAVRGSDWKRAIALLPARLLERGAKTRFADMKHKEAEEQYPAILADCAPGAAAGWAGQWRAAVDGAAEYCDAVERYGLEVVEQPRVKVGTIHSAKGAESDNVLWLTTSTRQCERSAESDEGANEERRVAYVAATRARKRLVVCVEPNQKYRARVG